MIIVGALAPIMLIGQTLAQTYSINKQAHAAANEYKEKATLARNEAAVERMKASQAADQGAREEKAIMDKLRLARGANAAAAGAAGLNYSGSLQDVDAASSEAAEEDLKTSLLNQRNKTWAYRTNELYKNINAARYDSAASNVKKQAKWQIASTIVGAAAQAYGAGMFGGGSESKTIFSGNSLDSSASVGANKFDWNTLSQDSVWGGDTMKKTKNGIYSW